MCCGVMQVFAVLWFWVVHHHHQLCFFCLINICARVVVLQVVYDVGSTCLDVFLFYLYNVGCVDCLWDFQIRSSMEAFAEQNNPLYKLVLRHPYK